MTTETLASYSPPEMYIKMYTANVRNSLSKKGGLITPFVSQGTYTGEKSQLVSFVGPVEFVERDTPYQDTKLTEFEHTQRWITGREYDCAVLIDRLDMLKMIFDPTSPYVERMREAAARKQDEIVMSAFFANAKTGKDGITSTSFPARDIVVHGGTRMSVAKLRAMRKLMKKRQLDLRSVRPYIAVTAEQIDDLLGEVVVGSSDYNSVKPLESGEVSGFMGFNFIPYEDNGTALNGRGIPTFTDGGTSDNVRQLPVWVPDGMQYGSWDDLVITINNRPDKNNIKQLHATFTGGATRIEEGRVFQLQVTEN